MHQLVRFGTCIHIFDTSEGRFVKSTAGRVASALGLAKRTGHQDKVFTRKHMLRRVDWMKCGGCGLGKKKDREHEHWIAVPSR